MELWRGGVSYRATFCGNGTLLAYGGTDGRVVIRDLKGDKVIHDSPIMKGNVRSIATLESNNKLAIGGDEPRVVILDVLSWKVDKIELDTRPRDSNFDPVDMVRSVVYFPKERLVAACTRGSIDFHLIEVGSLSVVGTRFIRAHIMCPIPGADLNTLGRRAVVHRGSWDRVSHLPRRRRRDSSADHNNREHDSLLLLPRWVLRCRHVPRRCA